MKMAFLLVDPQYDFFPGGSLGVQDGDQIIEPVNNLLAKFPEALVFVSRDWHPSESKHFMAGGGVWPPHCVQNTRGAEFHSGLNLPAPVLVTKGTDPEDDGGYSAFDGTVYFIGTDGRPDPNKPTSLLNALQGEGIDTLIVAGLATDYCVRATVLDALRSGLKVMVFLPGIRAVNLKPDDGAKALSEMKDAGALFLE